MVGETLGHSVPCDVGGQFTGPPMMKAPSSVHIVVCCWWDVRVGERGEGVAVGSVLWIRKFP